MLKNSKEVTDSRLSYFKEKDFDFFVKSTGLSRMEINRIFKIFNDKGGILNKYQFKEVFEELTRYWLSDYKDTESISDLVFRAFDKDHDSIMELKEFLEGSAILFMAKGDKKTKLEYIFDLYDINQDGSLTMSEIREGFRALFAMLGNENSELICKHLAESTMNDLGIQIEDPNLQKKSTAADQKSRKQSLAKNSRETSVAAVQNPNPKITKDFFVNTLLDNEQALNQLVFLFMPQN